MQHQTCATWVKKEKKSWYTFRCTVNRVNEKVRFGKWSRQIRGASAAKTKARTVVSWRTISESGSGGGGKRVIIVEGHAKIFGENKQAKKTKNCQSRVFIGTDSADRSFWSNTCNPVIRNQPLSCKNNTGAVLLRHERIRCQSHACFFKGNK